MQNLIKIGQTSAKIF